MTFEETLDALSDAERAFIAAALDAFDGAHPEGNGVIVEDLDDGALAWLKTRASSHSSVETAGRAGAEVVSRLYLVQTGSPALPHTQRPLLRVRGVEESCCGEPMALTNGTPCCRCTLDRFRAIHGRPCQWDPREESR